VIRKTFYEWVVTEVIPIHKNNMTWFRLDGWERGGNREVIGEFIYENRKWEVHGDTRFEPIFIAFNAIENGIDKDPFIIKNAKIRDCMTIKPEIYKNKRYKYFYVYSKKI